MRCLFLMDRYCDSNPACGPTLGEHVFVNPVRASNQVTDIKRFYYDEVTKQHGKATMAKLLQETCHIYLPSLIIYVPLGGELGQRLNPEDHALRKIVEELRIPLFRVVLDASPGCWPGKIPYCSFLGVDSVAAYRFYRHLPNVLLAYSAADPATFYDRKMTRDIDVSFVGSVDPTDIAWPQRHEYLTYLQENGINVRVAGGQRGARLDLWQMCEIYNRSKISLNFCRNGGGMAQLKGRVFEVTSCGAMLMDSEGTEATEFWVDGKEMKVFTSKDDLLRLVQYYLKNSKERIEIAEAGLRKTTDVWNAWNCWGHHFERMGFPVPDFLEKAKSYRLHRKLIQAIETR